MSSATKKPTQTWFRFSMRAMMLLVLLVGVLLGWQVNIARKQRAAVEAVKRSGGWVHYDYEFVNGKLTRGQSPWAPRWLRRTLGDEFFQNVRQVNLVYDDATGTRFDNSDVKACDDLLRQLSSLPGLTELLLKDTQATDEGLREIGKMTGLEELFMWDASSVSDAGVAHLQRLKNLKMIHINHSKITNDSLAVLSSLPRMEEMSLDQNRFSDQGLARLKGKDRLKRLHVGFSGLSVTDAGLAYLKDFKKLELLDIQFSEVTTNGLEQLKELPNLKELWVSPMKMTPDEAQRVQNVMPNLRVRH